jgi:hypothetical protein
VGIAGVVLPSVGSMEYGSEDRCNDILSSRVAVTRRPIRGAAGRTVVREDRICWGACSTKESITKIRKKN